MRTHKTQDFINCCTKQPISNIIKVRGNGVISTWDQVQKNTLGLKSNFTHQEQIKLNTIACRVGLFFKEAFQMKEGAKLWTGFSFYEDP